MIDPLVSLVIINYDYERFVEAAVDSALRQTYGRTEIIAVDDGSTDGSKAILTNYAGRITVLLKANGGQTDAVNAGFAASRGDIVMFLDSDDELHETAVAEVVAAWRPRTIKVQFALAIIDGDGKSNGHRLPVFPPDFSPEDVRGLVLHHGIYPSPPTSGNAYARSFLVQVMPIDAHMFPFAPDGAINAIAPLYGDVRSIDRALGHYRVHGDNMWATSACNGERMLKYVAVAMREAAFLRQHAARLGVTLADCNPLDYSYVHLERRLAAVKLEPTHPLVVADAPMALFRRACRCIGQDEPRVARRLTRLAWFLAIAVSPLPIARRLLEYRFDRHSRPVLVRGLVSLFNRVKEV